MLDAYRSQVDASRGAGLTGVTEHTRLVGVIRALLEVVDEDHDPRWAVTRA